MSQSKKTYEEILAILKDKIDLVDDFAYGEFYPEELGLGTIEEVHQQGGEGEGDYWCSVKYFKDHDIYIKVYGYYSSYHGTDFEPWDGSCSKVEPKEKTITVYESIRD